jgi:archaellum biogenesis ATPase FlaH
MSKADREPLDVAEMLKGATEGERDTTLFRLACKMRGDNVPREYAEAMVLEAARNCDPPFPESLALQKVDNAYMRYEPRESNDSSDWQTLPIAKTADAIDEAYRAFTIRDLLDGFESENALIPGLIYPGHLTLIGSFPGTGKTTLSNAVIAALVTGKEAFRLLRSGELVGPIMYVSELSGTSLSRTIQDLRNTYDLTEEQLTRHLRVYGLTGLSILDPVTATEFRERSRGSGLVIIDTFDAFLAANPNETQAVLKAWQILRDVATEGAAVCVMDHQGKTAMGYTENMAAVAGASAKQRLPDLVFRLDRRDEPRNGTFNALRPVKQRFGDAISLDLRLDDNAQLVATLGDGNNDVSAKLKEASECLLEFLSTRDQAQLKDLVQYGTKQGHSTPTFRRAIDLLLSRGKIQKIQHGVYILPLATTA